MSAEGRAGPEVVVVDSDLDSDEGEVQSGAGLDFLPLDPVPGSTRGRKRRREAQGGTQEPDAPVWRGAGQNEFTSLPQHSSLLRLHEEVLEFVSMMRPTAAEEEAANVTLLRVVSVVKHGWPDAEITLFGSRASGMALPEADWDICLNGVPCTQSALSQLGYDLRQSGHAREVEVIAKARVPIVKYCDAQSGIWVDISFNQDTGADSTRFIQEAASEWPQLRPMMLVLKYYLKQRGLAETYRGGIGSFLLSVMCIRALQVLRDQMAQSMQAQAAASRPKGSLPSWHKALKKGKAAPLISSLNIGAALMAFFELYGVKLNYVEVAISVRGAGAFFRKRASRLFNKSTRLDGLCVESPVDTTLDVGGGAWNTTWYRGAFQVTYNRLKDCIKAFSLQLSGAGGGSGQSKRKRGAGTSAGAAPVPSLLAYVLRVDQYLTERKDMLLSSDPKQLYGPAVASLPAAARGLQPPSMPSFLEPTAEGVLRVTLPQASHGGLGYKGAPQLSVEMHSAEEGGGGEDGSESDASDSASTSSSDSQATVLSEEGSEGGDQREEAAPVPAASSAGASGADDDGYDTSEEAAPKVVQGRTVRKARLIHHILTQKHCRPEAKAAAMDMTSWF